MLSLRQRLSALFIYLSHFDFDFGTSTFLILHSGKLFFHVNSSQQNFGF